MKSKGGFLSVEFCKGFLSKGYTIRANVEKRWHNDFTFLSKGDTMPLNVKKRWHIYNIYSILNKEHKYI